MTTVLTGGERARLTCMIPLIPVCPVSDMALVPKRRLYISYCHARPFLMTAYTQMKLRHSITTGRKRMYQQSSRFQMRTHEKDMCLDVECRLVFQISFRQRQKLVKRFVITLQGQGICGQRTVSSGWMDDLSIELRTCELYFRGRLT